MRRTLLNRIAGICMVLTAATGCASSTTMLSQWSSPHYESASFKRIMVAGVSEQDSIRRNFEDEFSSQLRSAGVDAFPSYRYTPDAEKVEETKLKALAQQSGADGLIIARAVNVEQKTELSPSYSPAPVFGVFGRHAGAIWQGPYGSPTVYRYNEYTSETTLYDIPRNEVVWTGTVKTLESNNVSSAIRKYVQTVIKALKDKNLLAPTK